MRFFFHTLFVQAQDKLGVEGGAGRVHNYAIVTADDG